jgi:thiamine biosynthesis lipoprotein
MRNLDFDPTNRSIRFAEPGVQIDFGGVGKGYALQRVRQILLRCGVENALVNFGDSSILAIGQHPFGDSWRVGVQHPDLADQTVHEWVVRNGSVSTSGASHRFVTGGGKKYGHIMDPRSGHPSDPLTSISVHSSCALEAEVLSTSLTVLDPSQRRKIMEERQNPGAVEIVIDDSGRCRARAIA